MSEQVVRKRASMWWIPCGHFRGVPIFLSSFLVPLVALCLASGTFIALACVLACALAHELAHASVAIDNDVDCADIILTPISGGMRPYVMPENRPSVMLAIVVAGPLANAALASIALAIATNTGSVSAAWFGELNLAMALVNLIPAFPLDGGRILKAVVHLTSRRRAVAEVCTARVGLYCAAAITLFPALHHGSWANLPYTIVLALAAVSEFPEPVPA